MINEFRQFDLTKLHELVTAWDEYQIHVKGKKSKHKPTISDPDNLYRYTDAFQLAFDLLVTKKEQVIDVLDKFIDKVILPFWSYRPRLYEIWSLIMTMRQFPEKAELKLSLEEREDIPNTYEWKIQKGKSSNAVGVFELNGRRLEVWFERTTKNLGGDRYITPDIRIMTAEGEDIFILELKDRYRFSNEEATVILKKYATGSRAKSVCIVNYSPFDADFLKGHRMILNEEDKVLYLVNEFKPGNLDQEVIGTIKRLVIQFFESYDLILDVSGSISGIDINGQIKFITEKRGGPHQIFFFSDKLKQVKSVIDQNYEFVTSGNTDVKKILEEYKILDTGNNVQEVIAMTDEESVEQFKQYPLSKNFSNIGFSIYLYGKNADPVNVISTRKPVI